MELTILLMEKIISLFLIVLLGYFIVRVKLVDVSEARTLSKLIMYAITPCVFFNAFSREFTWERFYGFLLAMTGAVLVHIIYIAAGAVLKRTIHLTPIEQASIIHTNGANLTIPLVASVLGQDWVFYACGYIMVQNMMMWSHAKMVVSEQKNFVLKELLLNPNTIALTMSFLMFLFNIQLPPLLNDAVTPLANTIGPLSMLVIGMSIAKCDLKKVFFGSLRIYWVTALRLIVFPMMIVLVFRFSGLFLLHRQAKEILMVTLIAASAPAGALITQFAQVFHKDYESASSINVCTVIFCIITMPLIIMIYQWL